jgi:hypothetical protein
LYSPIKSQESVLILHFIAILVRITWYRRTTVRPIELPKETASYNS